MNQPTQGRQLVLIGGGARSGKSSFALALARRLGTRKVFLATAEARDQEMEQRMAEHRRRRGEDFQTIEEPLGVPATLASLRDADVVVVDCLTFWLANLLLRDEAPERILARVEELIAVLGIVSMHAILVTNEVGMGVVPDNALARAFRDVTGTAHRRLSRVADQLYVGVLGTMLRLKPVPVEVCSWEEC
jgi:adenosylcobinamide kinase/adenosylcobinamide-phosphate guanylyltransferase